MFDGEETSLEGPPIIKAGNAIDILDSSAANGISAHQFFPHLIACTQQRAFLQPDLVDLIIQCIKRSISSEQKQRV